MFKFKVTKQSNETIQVLIDNFSHNISGHILTENIMKKYYMNNST